MKIAIPKERWPGETRAAASPESVKKYTALGLEVVVETGAGVRAALPDAAYKAAGAKIARSLSACLNDADIVLKVRRPLGEGEGKVNELALIKEGAILIGLLEPYDHKDHLQLYAKQKIQAFSMELVPRISRAQSMDVLSSQSNLAGYRAVLDAAGEFSRIYPMLMTAAGTVPPARIVVIGAGVAGLQAIATARRLGAVVSAFDVRPAAKEQVESLGASFINVEDDNAAEAETAGGYAKEMSEDYKRRQAAKLHEVLKKTDIVITTALIPGRPAPLIVTEAMVADMKPGSVLVDLAAERGGNVAGVKPDEIVVTPNGAKLVGHVNVPARVATDATNLYAKNLLNFVTPMIDQDNASLHVNPEDEIIAGTLLTQNGAVIHPNFSQGD